LFSLSFFFLLIRIIGDYFLLLLFSVAEISVISLYQMSFLDFLIKERREKKSWVA